MTGPVLSGAAVAGGMAVGVVAAAGSGMPGGVVVAADLTPGQVVALGAGVVAVATAGGAPLSHAAILARSLGVPVVTGLGPEILALPAGTAVLVDGHTGTVHVRPGPAEVEAAGRRARHAALAQEQARRRATEPAVTVDGQAVAVVANVGTADETALAVAAGADGIGMLRTEFAFLNRADAPGEDEQYLAYRAVADALGDRPLVVRTLDLGADIPAWGGEPEANPALGNRGIRFTLGAPALLDAQLRAIARLAEERPVQVMFPMVTTVDEVRQARARLEAVARPAAVLDVGVTVEVPAAAVCADALAPAVDFLTVGSNDLTQYTLAVDRANAAVAGLADGLHPAVLRLVAGVCAAAGGRHRLPVTIVGELASDPAAVPVLLGLGIGTLSVRPNAVAAVKQAVRAVSLADARRLAGAALDAGSASAVRALLGG